VIISRNATTLLRGGEREKGEEGGGQLNFETIHIQGSLLYSRDKEEVGRRLPCLLFDWLGEKGGDHRPAIFYVERERAAAPSEIRQEGRRKESLSTTTPVVRPFVE